MEATEMAGWSDFFIAAAGAAGALAGLVIVAVSINLVRILELPGVPERAAEVVILLSGTLAGTLVCLVPHLSPGWRAVALGAVALPSWLVPVIIQYQSIRRGTYYRVSHAVLRCVLHQVATLPGMLAALGLAGLIPGGVAWFALDAIASMLVAMFTAWVLLIEILR